MTTGMRRSPTVERHGRRSELTGDHSFQRYSAPFFTPRAQEARRGPSELTNGFACGRRELGAVWRQEGRQWSSCYTPAVARTPKRPVESKAKGSAASAPRYDGRHVVADEKLVPRSEIHGGGLILCSRRDPNSG